MKKNLVILYIIGMTVIVSFNSFRSSRSPLSFDIPPSGYSGAPTQNKTCRNCHSSFSLNTAGGNVNATGLPTGSYIPGHVYNFSVTITNATPMAIWGFELKAVTSGGSTAIGTFSTTNPNATISSGEIKHNLAISSNGTSFTYNNLSWTAPPTGSSSVSFYMTGVAGNNDGSETSDYVYSNAILNITIPITLGDFSGAIRNNAAILKWETYTESASRQFEVERSTNGINFETIDIVASAGNSSTLKNYYCTDNSLPKNRQTFYFRLNMVDQDGRSEYSKVLVLKRKLDNYVENIYPTLIKGGDKLHIDVVSNTDQPGEISIYNSIGQKLVTQKEILKSGSNSIILDMSKLIGNGIYTVEVRFVNFKETRTLLVQY